MIRAVVDTSIEIRAVIEGTVGPILVKLRDAAYTLVYSQTLLDELLEKLASPRIRDKYKVDEDAVETLLALVALRGEIVQPSRKIEVCRDPDDNAILEAAVDGEAGYIVTGDEDLLVLDGFEGIRVLTPRMFLELLE